MFLALQSMIHLKSEKRLLKKNTAEIKKPNLIPKHSITINFGQIQLWELQQMVKSLIQLGIAYPLVSLAVRERMGVSRLRFTVE